MDGFVVAGKLPHSCLKVLEEGFKPLVYLDFYAPGSRTVSALADSCLGGWEITRYLIGCGHRDIGCLSSIGSGYNAQDRYFGFCKTLLEAGLTPKAEWIISNRAKEGFFDRYALPSPLPTAFVCDCNQSAYHFTRDLQRQGYSVPGFYNHVFSTLTTYAADMGLYGPKSRGAITALINGESPQQRITISGGLVFRDSVKKISLSG